MFEKMQHGTNRHESSLTSSYHTLRPWSFFFHTHRSTPSCSPISVFINSILPIAQAKKFCSYSWLLFLSYSRLNLSGNSISSILKIYPESRYVLPRSLLYPNHHHCVIDLLQQLGYFPDFILAWLQQSDPFKMYGRLHLPTAQNPPFFHSA